MLLPTDSTDTRHHRRITDRALLRAAALVALAVALGACAARSPHPAPITHPTPAGALRWSPAFRDTIPLWIDSAVTAAGWHPALVAEVAAAAAEWSTADMPVHFQRVAEPDAAAVRVRWRRWQPGTCRGTTRRWVNARGEIVGAEVTIVLAPKLAAQVSAAPVLRAIALHELGHALGLPHDSDERAIMYQSVGPLAVTERDRGALRSAYGVALPPWSVAAAAAAATPAAPSDDRRGAAGVDHR
jgi:hypothetical protein